MYFIEKRELIALFLVARGWIFIPTKMKHSMKMMKLSNLNKTFRRGESLVKKKQIQIINMLELTIKAI